MQDFIDENVQRFIRDHISSVVQLEILLLLQTNPRQTWSPAQLAHELRIEPAGTQPPLEGLLKAGLLQKDDQGNFYYAPASDDLHSTVVALAQAYLMKRVTIIAMIFSKPPESLRAFSDAFRLRKEPDHGPRG